MRIALPPTRASATLACPRSSTRPDGLSRYSHGLRGLLVTEPLEVDQADRLELVDRELQVLELAGGHACRFEERDARDAGDGALDGWARHPDLSPGTAVRASGPRIAIVMRSIRARNNEHMLIMYTRGAGQASQLAAR